MVLGKLLQSGESIGQERVWIRATAGVHPLPEPGRPLIGLFLTLLRAFIGADPLSSRSSSFTHELDAATPFRFVENRSDTHGRRPRDVVA